MARRKTKEDKRKPLRVLSFGAGAIGTYIGGSLALKGHHIVFLERPEAAEELRENGLTLKIKEKVHRVPDVTTFDSLESALEEGPYDVALFALKSFDTIDALEEIEPYASQMPPILSLQNGVENEALITRVLGKDKAIAGTVTSAVERKGVGNVVLQRRRGMGVGAEHPISSTLVEAFIEAGLNARLYRHAADMKWSKMLTNLLANATSAILDMPPGEIFEHQELAAVEVAQLREALQVMTRSHINAVDLPGTPVRALTFAVRSLPPPLARNLLKNAVGGGRGGKMPSFHIDLHNGRGASEVNYLNGAVVRYGEKAGVRTPVNATLTEILTGLTTGKLPLDAFSGKPEALLAEIEKGI